MFRASKDVRWSAVKRYVNAASHLAMFGKTSVVHSLHELVKDCRTE
jgi:hypothetical protein